MSFLISFQKVKQYLFTIGITDTTDRLSSTSGMFDTPACPFTKRVVTPIPAIFFKEFHTIFQILCPPGAQETTLNSPT